MIFKEWDECPFCGSKNIDIITYGGKLRYCECRDCCVSESRGLFRYFSKWSIGLPEGVENIIKQIRGKK